MGKLQLATLAPQAKCMFCEHILYYWSALLLGLELNFLLLPMVSLGHALWSLWMTVFYTVGEDISYVAFHRGRRDASTRSKNEFESEHLILRPLLYTQTCVLINEP